MIPYIRQLLLLYLLAIVLVSLFIIIFIWVPSTKTVSIEKTINSKPLPSSNSTGSNNTGSNNTGSNNTGSNNTGSNNTGSNNTEASFPANARSRTETTTTTINSTTKETRTQEFLQFGNGTNQTRTVALHIQPVQGGNPLLSTNPEIRLVSIAALFGLLGASISGITSVLNRRIWDSGNETIRRRLVYNYLSRPWVGMAVGLVTYVTLRAGLFNGVGGNVGSISVISDFGVAAISAIVGLMTDEIMLRLRDAFRFVFGIEPLKQTREIELILQKDVILVGDTVVITASFPDIQPTPLQEVIAYFSVQDTNIVKITETKVSFTSTGLASTTLIGLAPGRSYITVMTSGELYDSKAINVNASTTDVASATTSDTRPIVSNIAGGLDTRIDSARGTNGDAISFGGETTSPGITFTFSGSKNGLDHFECRLDANPFQRCDSDNQQTYQNLRLGSHEFQVRAVGLNDVEDPSPATWRWTVKGS